MLNFGGDVFEQMTFNFKKIVKFMIKNTFPAVLLVLSTFVAISQCKVPVEPEREELGMVENNAISEASGIAASAKNSSLIWVHNDGGNPPDIFAMDSEGGHVATFRLDGVRNRDWEDMGLGPGPAEGQSYLYIGDIGDNNGVYEQIYVHRIPEPSVHAGDAPYQRTITDFETITLQYPDGPRDSETLMVDPRTKDLIIISKRENNVGIYIAEYPQSVEETVTLDKVGTLKLSSITAGDISPSGSGILLKDYQDIYYWPRSQNLSISEALSKSYNTVRYIPEFQGEAVTWEPDEKGYYTVSEEPGGMPAYLYFYRWKK